jgi:hypothetical protein
MGKLVAQRATFICSYLSGLGDRLRKLRAPVDNSTRIGTKLFARGFSAGTGSFSTPSVDHMGTCLASPLSAAVDSPGKRMLKIVFQLKMLCEKDWEREDQSAWTR